MSRFSRQTPSRDRGVRRLPRLLAEQPENLAERLSDGETLVPQLRAATRFTDDHEIDVGQLVAVAAPE